MSSDDDWENQCNSDNEKEEEKKQEEKKAAAAKFADEDEVDPIELAKKKKEEIKKQQEEQMANARAKASNKVDYDKIYAERQTKLGVTPVETGKAEEAKGSKAAKGIALEKAAEEGLANQLFGDDAGPSIALSSEKDYIAFAKKVSEALYAGNAPYHVEKFLKKVAEDMPKHCDSKHMKGVADNMQLMYNNKVKEERKLDKNVKKKAAVLKGGGGKGYDRNNNANMINDVMGNDAEYGEEEETVGFKKEEEADFDFM